MLEEEREDLEDHGMAIGVPVCVYETASEACEARELCVDCEHGTCKLLHMRGSWRDCNTGTTAGASVLVFAPGQRVGLRASTFVSCLLWQPPMCMLLLGERWRRPMAASAEPARLFSISAVFRFGVGIDVEATLPR